MRILSKLILARERQPLAQSTWAVTSPSPRKRPHLKLPNDTNEDGFNSDKTENSDNDENGDNNDNGDNSDYEDNSDNSDNCDNGAERKQ